MSKAIWVRTPLRHPRLASIKDDLCIARTTVAFCIFSLKQGLKHQHSTHLTKYNSVWRVISQGMAETAQKVVLILQKSMSSTAVQG